MLSVTQPYQVEGDTYHTLGPPPRRIQFTIAGAAGAVLYVTIFGETFED
jgi:hypothetical protein